MAWEKNMNFSVSKLYKFAEKTLLKMERPESEKLPSVGNFP